MSFWSWAIIIQKHIAFACRREPRSLIRSFWSGEPLDELFDRIGPDPQGASQKIFRRRDAGVAAQP